MGSEMCIRDREGREAVLLLDSSLAKEPEIIDFHMGRDVLKKQLHIVDTLLFADSFQNDFIKLENNVLQWREGIIYLGQDFSSRKLTVCSKVLIRNNGFINQEQQTVLKEKHLILNANLSFAKRKWIKDNFVNTYDVYESGAWEVLE